MDDLSNSPEEGKGLPFEFRARPVDDPLREENWKAVEAAIRQQSEAAPVRGINWSRTFLVAASMIGVAFGIWYIGARTGTPQMSLLRTGYGEVKNILLPDSSVVVLNANSSLRIQQQWTDGDSRQVWLDGEAYFQVQKKSPTRQKFVVHTRDLDVEVLGTKFNVNTRRQHSIVSLEEGKVRLSMHGTVQSVIEKKAPMVLRPGQVVVVDEARQVKVNEEKDVAAHSGWSRNEFHFDNTSLQEVARLIEDTYDYKMEAKDTSLYSRSISGDLRAASVQELVKVLEVTLKLNMRIQNKTIYVTNP
ncbi:MAG TPA: FecR domain-containing protein [Puia sp.]|nr:FecR domain-containing protein [Puia sp.]